MRGKKEFLYGFWGFEGFGFLKGVIDKFYKYLIYW